MTFRDHFSGHADDYSRYRPRYPDALFDWLRSEAPALPVWDCATGNGQAAVALAERFPDVWATDASDTQIAAAEPHPRVRYAVQPAHDSGLPADSVGLVTVAQALHWFDFPAFFAEADRVLVPGGLLVAWCYELFAITPEVDAPMLELYHDIVGADWPPERRHIEAGYTTIPWPHPTIATPDLAMEADWTVDQVLGYLRTWSATRRWQAREGRDPVALVEARIRAAWGAAPTRRVRWPLTIRASRV
ncbi:MAG: class I SAM-dependent methyltransferase [Myxococcota bacterium]